MYIHILSCVCTRSISLDSSFMVTTSVDPITEESEICIDNHEFENEDSVPLPLHISNPQSQKM